MNYKSIRSVFCVCISLLILLCSCETGEKIADKKLNIGVNDINGVFNPFYAVSEGDQKINTQIFSTIQRRGIDNKMINNVGSITYEYVGSNKVKYTVAIRNDLKFTDGTSVNIDDVIFFYYFISDATYDGVFSDFYLNDIEGIKEYYYDDNNYAERLAEISENGKDSEKIQNYIKKNYENGIDVKEIKGISRVDDYTCTVLFNSRNINAVSELNAFIVSKAFYTAEYVKGAAQAVKEFTTQSLGCGPYYISDYNPESGKVELRVNTDYYDTKPVFSKLSFIDLTQSKKDAVSLLNSGEIDTVTLPATSSVISQLNSGNLKYSISNSDYYVSLGINTRTITDNTARRQIMKMTDIYSVLDEELGSYYTRIYMPLSVRFSEYPDVSAPFYEGIAIPKLISTEKNNFNFYCSFEKGSLEYKIAQNIVQSFENNEMKCKLIECTHSELISAVKSKKADLWLSRIADGATCDKYDYYHTDADYNLYGISDAQIDSLTELIRKSTGFADKKEMISNLLKSVMEQAAEMPLYQLQTVTVYNTDVINEDSISDMSDYDSFDYLIPQLY